jgi:hypothetical protein
VCQLLLVSATGCASGQTLPACQGDRTTHGYRWTVICACHLMQRQARIQGGHASRQQAGRQAGGQACLAACHPHMPCMWGCMHACVEPTYGQQRGFAVRQALNTRLHVGAFSPQEWCSSSTHQTHTHGLPAQPCCGMHVLALVKDHSVAPAVHSCTCRHKQH